MNARDLIRKHAFWIALCFYAVGLLLAIAAFITAR
jgi:hypothetical protein